VTDRAIVPAADAAGADVAVLEGYDRSDFSFPRIRLLQPVSAEVARGDVAAGRFYHTMLGDLGPEIDIIPLIGKKTRARFAERALRCVSVDFTTGRGDPGGDCLACPLKDWSPDGTPPACSLTYNFIVLPASGAAAEFPLPAVLQFAKSGVKTARKLNSVMALIRPPWRVRLKLKAVRQENDRGVFYITTFTLAGATAEEEWPRYAQTAQLVAGTLAAQPEAIEHAAEDMFDEPEEAGAAGSECEAAAPGGEPLNF
jgi:hypothetical protein